MSRWGDRDRKRSKKQKVKVSEYRSREKSGDKDSAKRRRDDQLNRELERFGQDIEESVSNETNQTVTVFNERTR